MLVTLAIPQSQEYHDFANKSLFLGIPNTLSVISNFSFFMVGLIGLVLCYYGNYFKLSFPGEVCGWIFFFIGMAAVAFVSSLYHLKPNDARLVWNRFPITVAFTSIIAIFIIVRVDARKGTFPIIPLLLAGIVSILYWRSFYDLRPYALVQFVPCIANRHIIASYVYTFNILAVGSRISWTKVKENGTREENVSYAYSVVPVEESK